METTTLTKTKTIRDLCETYHFWSLRWREPEWDDDTTWQRFQTSPEGREAIQELTEALFG